MFVTPALSAEAFCLTFDLPVQHWYGRLGLGLLHVRVNNVFHCLGELFCANSTFFLCRAEEGEGESSGEEEEEDEEEGEVEKAAVVQEEKAAVEAKAQEVASAAPGQRETVQEQSQPKQDSPRYTIHVCPAGGTCVCVHLIVTTLCVCALQ